MTVQVMTAALTLNAIRVEAAAPAASETKAGSATDMRRAVEMEQHLSSPQTEVIVQANASTQADLDRFDNRVTGPTENVRTFDRMANIEQGFEHLREIFANMQAESERAAASSPMADGQSAMALPEAGSMDIKL